MSEDLRAPAPVGVTLDAFENVRHDHRLQATRGQRLAERMTAVFANPLFIAALIGAVILWIGGNLVVDAIGRRPWDPPPFYWLQGLASMTAVYSIVLILATRRREAAGSRRERGGAGATHLWDRNQANVRAMITKDLEKHSSGKFGVFKPKQPGRL